ncbi:alpha-amylase family glycosyl hydrolase [Aerococcaceae bacterium WGS1372]
MKDYRQVDPNYGSLDEFEELVEQIHQRDMKVMIDIVYNHTSPDSLLVKNHPGWFSIRHQKETLVIEWVIGVISLT